MLSASYPPTLESPASLPGTSWAATRVPWCWERSEPGMSPSRKVSRNLCLSELGDSKGRWQDD